MEQHVKQINVLKQTTSQIEGKLSYLDSEVKTMSKDLDNFDRSIKYFGDSHDDIITENSQMKTKVDNLCARVSKLELSKVQLEESQRSQYESLRNLKSEQYESGVKQKSIETKLIDVQWRSMRENLIFTGVKEETDENPEMTLRTFMSETMKINDEVPLDRVHRLGKIKQPQPGEEAKPRPLIAKFERYRDKEMVRMAAPTALEGTDYGVREQYPVEIEDKRRILYPVMRSFKKNKQNKVRLIRDKLFINDIEYIPTEDEINAVKQRRQPEYRNRDSAYANDKRDEQSTSRQSYRYDERQNSGQQWRQDRVIYNR